ncbi:antitoxin VbhA family protein, partial [Psychrobacter aquimaris]|uniref:antitoxin VbhA family protein n=1 Tax=Psychrobacter aquimaris TaxID=292733 RepID=UPI003FCFBAFA
LKCNLKTIESRLHTNKLNTFSGTFMKKPEDQEITVDNRPILVSQKEIENRRRISSDGLADFAVDNIPINPDTRHIFNDYVEGRIATIEEVESLLDAHYTKVAF